MALQPCCCFQMTLCSTQMDQVEQECCSFCYLVVVVVVVVVVAAVLVDVAVDDCITVVDHARTGDAVVVVVVDEMDKRWDVEMNDKEEEECKIDHIGGFLG